MTIPEEIVDRACKGTATKEDAFALLDVKKAQEFVNEKLIYDFILNLTPEKAREIGIKHKSALTYMKKKNQIKNGFYSDVTCFL